MEERDVLVVSPYHDIQARKVFMSAYQHIFRCINDAKGPDVFSKWPHILLSTSSAPSFWTKDGFHSSQPISNQKDNANTNANVDTCRESVPDHIFKKQENVILTEAIHPIGHNLDLKNLGLLHPWHKDCMHWIQPGVPDVYAAEVADYLLETMM
eukprot:CAMPEP_0204639050 /NCGR_PEP_ID=MMETSP0717-20131115/41538_1 /ASSEMBLY_ACC=CAM_ASM_000666 /TAXON_ID=230516 /ORGANISM="Chaetoceros curvisetus" /LENGTH=153 /DNA_ID=CAMNT_0051659013 /DNA_START=50 /DNA_END=511 /DNA_ORIENTATION=-